MKKSNNLVLLLSFMTFVVIAALLYTVHKQKEYNADEPVMIPEQYTSRSAYLEEPDYPDQPYINQFSEEVRSKFLYREVDFNLPKYVKLKDTTEALMSGLVTFHLPTSSKASCASCHDGKISGHSNDEFPFGRRGKLDEIMRGIVGSSWKVDLQNVRTPPLTLSCYIQNALTSGELGMGGMNEGISDSLMIKSNWRNVFEIDGIYTQIIAGMDVHDLGSLPVETKNIKAIDTLLKNAFYPLTSKQLSEYRLSQRELEIIVAMGMWEKINLPNTHFQRSLMGLEEFKYWDGFNGYGKYCESCHGGVAMGLTSRAYKIGQSDYKGLQNVTGLSIHNGYIKVPTIVNADLAPFKFHTSEKMTIYKTNLAHQRDVMLDFGNQEKTVRKGYIPEMTKQEARDIARFVKFGLTDKDIGRLTKPEYIKQWSAKEAKRMKLVNNALQHEKTKY